MLAFLSVGCNTSKYLQENELLITRNEIKFVDDSPLAKQFGIESNMEAILEQQPNSRYLGMKREWLYIQAQKKSEDHWLKGFYEKQGERPTIYSDSLTNISENSLENYLFNQGYFDAQVKSEIRKKKKKATVVYSIQTRSPYYIDQIQYYSKDTGISDLLDSLQQTSLLQIGEVIKDVNYQLERARLTQAFLNHGYANFYSNLISPLKLDTTGQKNAVTLEVYIPSGQRRLEKKRIGQVKVLSDYLLGEQSEPTDTQYIEDLTFYLLKEKSTVDIKTIANKIYLKPGAYTSKVNFDETYRGLGDLGVFKFISVTPSQSTQSENVVDYLVQLTPNKKRVFDTGIDLNYSTVQTEGAGRNLLGLTGSVRLENRNLWGKAINLAVRGEVGAEINLAEVDSFNTFSTNLEATMNIPRFVGFPGTLKFLSLVNVGKKKLLSPAFIKNLNQRASTRINAQYQNVNVTDFYRYTTVDLTYGYDVPVNNRKRYQINTLGINYYRPDTLSQFGEITGDEPYVLRSFLGDRLFTGFLFRDFNFYYRSKSSLRGSYWTVNFFTEVSGLEVWAVNTLYNSFTNKSGKFVLRLDEDIDFARFTKFDFQFRYNFPLSSSEELAFRFNPGVVFSMDNTNVPFVKQFFMGGPQSLRAWQVREVGPGANDISTTIGDGRPYFSAGDVKLEMNLEYRFDLFWMLKSAVFLDMGNVWLLEEDDGGGKFGSDFWKQIAIGTGVGLRLDVEFVLFRLDLGYKLRNPFPDPDNGSYLFNHQDYPIVLGRMLNDIAFNLAIGYPF